MSKLFSPITLRDITFRNRIFVSPMCMYSSDDGMPNDWHLVHLGARAVGGAAAVIVEATAISPEARISPFDSGIWSQNHVEAFKRLSHFIKQQGAIPGVQLAHAGRKASTDAPWKGGKPVPPETGGWLPVAPSALAFRDGYPVPTELDETGIKKVVDDFVTAAKHAADAGFEVIELHMAHGYLLHQFLSPLSNQRQDQYGGSLDNRLRLPLRVTQEVRKTWPAHLPMMVRISATDWAPNGWDLAQSIELSKRLKELHVDLIDCSSGGLVPHAKIPVAPGYQVEFAHAIRREVGIATGAVGMITEPQQAQEIIATGKADVVLLAREILRDPNWPLNAARELGAEIAWPKQYERARP